jgi:hypothetical protein
MVRRRDTAAGQLAAGLLRTEKLQGLYSLGHLRTDLRRFDLPLALLFLRRRGRVQERLNGAEKVIGEL